MKLGNTTFFAVMSKIHECECVVAIVAAVDGSANRMLDIVLKSLPPNSSFEGSCPMELASTVSNTPDMAKMCGVSGNLAKRRDAQTVGYVVPL